MTHTERPTEVSFAGEENELHTVIVEVHSTAIIDIFSTTANYEQFNPWIAWLLYSHTYFHWDGHRVSVSMLIAVAYIGAQTNVIESQ